MVAKFATDSLFIVCSLRNHYNFVVNCGIEVKMIDRDFAVVLLRGEREP